jgi:putative ABC transport system substrate-binding protein
VISWLFLAKGYDIVALLAKGDGMRRREFITFLGSVAVALPPAARAQQPVRMRRLGVLMAQLASEPEWQKRLTVLHDRLRELGWHDNTLRIETRWGGGNVEDVQKYAAELVALAPDAIVAAGSPPVAALQHATKTIPIVFVAVPDPVGAGYVASLARPGGNMTGFTFFDYSISSKWLELLKDIAPSIKRAAVIRDPTIAAGVGQYGVLQAIAPTFGIEVNPIGVRDRAEFEVAIAAFAERPNGGLIVTAGALPVVHRSLIISLAAKLRLPAVYPFSFFATDGGLIAYGPDTVDPYRRAADYVDRILKGEKPADLPVQAPTKYELVINLKTAKALGLDLPATVLARADAIIE